MANDSLNIGFIGLGNLGEPLCNSLVKAGYKVTVTDLHKASAQRLLEGGASWSDDVAGVCRQADVVITALPSPAASRKVVEGPGGVFESLPSGAVWIEMSTTDFQDLQRLQGLAQARGIEVLECPVTGGVHLASSGQITVLVGGDPATAARVDAVLKVMGGEVIYLGKLGSASVVKVVTNMLAFIHLVADGEALMLAKKGGIDLKTAYDVIQASSGNSFVHETEGQLVLNGSYQIDFSFDLALKDLGFIDDMSREYNVPVELASLVRQTYIRGKAQYGGDAESPMIVKLLEDACGTDLRAPGFPARIEV
jgi:3-hydroxyisobutyrate dehydrogenase